MSDDEMQVEPGGFLPPTLPSPPPSTVSTSASPLPRPRTTALRPGGSKENALRNYVDDRLLEISGRFERRFRDAYEATGPGHESERRNAGYKGFTELARDLEGVIDIIWVSGSPALQIPFLLTIALSVTNYLQPFSFAPQATLQLLQKLDCAFSSLLHGQDVVTGDSLPGFETGRRITVTEKVRLQGLVERTRVLLIDVSKRGDLDTESQDGFQETTASEDDDNAEVFGDLLNYDLDVAKVYERTLADLSDLETSFGS